MRNGIDKSQKVIYNSINDIVSKEPVVSNGTPVLTANRRSEIISACEKLYETVSFNDITLGEISKETSFSRPLIYNYFETKKEIFLALM